MTRTERVDKILREAIEGENLDVLLNALNPSDQNLFYDLVAEIRQTGEFDLEDFWSIDYLRKPPTMEEFITDPYWIGEVTVKSEESTGLFPAWKDILCRDFNLDSRMHNCVVTGSLGSGKSYVAALIMCYRIVLCRLLRNPRGFLGLSKGSGIIFGLLSVTQSQVKDTIFADVTNFMGNSVFFREECGFNPDKKYANLLIPLGNQVFLRGGSRGQHILGRNTLAVALDEGNWRLEANPDDKAYKLYDEVRTRISNRFQKVAGFLPAVSIIASSARDETSFTEKVIKEIEAANDPRTQRVYRMAAFDVRRHELTLKPRWFKVAFGLKTMAPKILTGWYKESGEVIEAGEEIPQGARTRLVPEDYIEPFKRNVSSALQGICGETTGAAYRLFGDFSIVETAVTDGERAGLVNPVSQPQIPLSNENDKELWDFIDSKKLVCRQLGRFMPLRDPEMPRFAHYDLATANQAGVAICHTAGRKLVQGVYDQVSGRVFSQYRPLIEYDLILAIVPGEQKEISLIKIQNLFFWLRDRCGFRFDLITADSYQSVAPLQLLENGGFATDSVSVDKTKEVYYSWRTGFQEGLIRMFRHPVLMTEAEYLLDLPKKIEHDQNHEKDCCDAAASAYANAIRGGAQAINTGYAIPDLYGSSPGMGEKPPIDIPIPEQKSPTRVFAG